MGSKSQEITSASASLCQGLKSGLFVPQTCTLSLLAWDLPMRGLPWPYCHLCKIITPNPSQPSSKSLFQPPRSCFIFFHCLHHIVVQWLSHVQLCAIPCTAAYQASLSFTVSQRSLFKLKFIELVMLSKYLILCHPLLLLSSIFPSIRIFSSEWLFSSGGQGIGTYAAAAAKSLQSCLTLCEPIDGSPPGSAVPGILQARTLEWDLWLNSLLSILPFHFSKFVS